MQKSSSAIIFDLGRKNFYSLTSLVATIDSMGELNDLSLLLYEKITVKDIKKLLKKFSYLIIGFSFRTAQIKTIYERMNKIYYSLKKEELDRIIFIAGGSHASGEPETTLKLGFDFSFIGEAEYSLPFFLKSFLNNEDIKITPGIAFLDEEGRINRTKPPSPIKLDDYPFLSRKRGLYPPLEITRGCSFGCMFCQVPLLFHRKVRHRSPDIIINTVKWMVKKKLNDIRFITPNSFGYMSSKAREVNKESILYLLESIREINGIRNVYFGTFPGEVRPETVSENLVEDIKPYISNKRISIGLQSGSDKVLDLIKRGHSVKEGLDAINILENASFVPIVDIIFRIPGATLEDELQTIQLIEKLVRGKSIVRAHVFMPLPGTVLEKTPFKPTFPEIRKRLGALSNKGKIEGSWTHQEKYAKSTWKMIRSIKKLPPIKREDSD